MTDNSILCSRKIYLSKFYYPCCLERKPAFCCPSWLYFCCSCLCLQPHLMLLLSGLSGSNSFTGLIWGCWLLCPPPALLRCCGTLPSLCRGNPLLPEHVPHSHHSLTQSYHYSIELNTMYYYSV